MTKHPLLILGFAIALVLCATRNASTAETKQPASAPTKQSDKAADFSKAMAAEALANAGVAINIIRWDADKVREISRNIATLPERAAGQALWALAKAPSHLDTVSAIAQAMSSSSLDIRLQAIDILLADGSDHAMRFILNRAVSEPDENAVRHIVAGMAKLPAKTAIYTLMDLILTPNAQPAAIAAAADHLRRLTRANLDDNPGAWREWWFDNEHIYQ